MMYALVATVIVATGTVVTFAVLSRRDKSDLVAAHDLLSGERSKTRELQHMLTVEQAAHAVTAEQFKTEQNLRSIAEAQRNEAQRKVRAQIQTFLPMASDAEIQEITNEVFASPLSLAPRAPERVPKLPDPDDPRDALLDPWADVQPAKPA